MVTFLIMLSIVICAGYIDGRLNNAIHGLLAGITNKQKQLAMESVKVDRHSAQLMPGGPYREEQPNQLFDGQTHVVEQISLNERVMRLFPLLFDVNNDWSSMSVYASKGNIDINVKIKGREVKARGSDFAAAILDLESKLVVTLEEQAKAIDADLSRIRAGYKLLQS